MDTVLGVFLNYALRSQCGGVVATTDVWMLSRGGLEIPQMTRIFSQIIATSHDLTPKGGLGEKSPYFWEI